MKICLYGASSNDIPPLYISATERLGETMATRGHTLIYGGGAGGLMGAAARGTTRRGGSVIGVAPAFFKADGVLFKGCTKIIYTDTMRQRKQLMEENSDAFIMTPGGIGTFDEFFEIITLKQLGRHNKPVAVFNINGYFDELDHMLDKAVNQGFMTEKSKTLAPMFSDAEKLVRYLEQAPFEQDGFNLNDFKRVDY